MVLAFFFLLKELKWTNVLYLFFFNKEEKNLTRKKKTKQEVTGNKTAFCLKFAQPNL